MDTHLPWQSGRLDHDVVADGLVVEGSAAASEGHLAASGTRLAQYRSKVENAVRAGRLGVGVQEAAVAADGAGGS